MTCPKCGYKNPDDYKRCWHCWHSHGWSIPLSKNAEPTDECKLCGREFPKPKKEISWD